MQAGQMLAHYRVEEKIGAGGMGEVYRAQDTVLDRDVALKVLPPEFAANGDRMARFQREAKVLASLHHPNIASIFGFESTPDCTFLVMELVEGEDLSEILRRGPLPVEEAVDISRQIAEGLEEAHEKGIIHRDLKPANVKRTPDGKVKVLDFGLARAFAGETAEEDQIGSAQTMTAPMTMAGTIMGTAAYMSPEQARGKEVDRRTDIWAFGLILFEMLTGHQNFAGETASDTLAGILKTEPSWDLLPSNLPFQVERVLRRCLAKDPRQRLRDIGEARVRLEDPEAESGMVSGPISIATESGPRWQTLLPWALVAISLAVAGFAFWKPKTETILPLRKFEIPLEKGDHSANVDFAPKISPDGQFLLYISQDQIWLRDLATTVSRPLPDTEDARDPFWSPDSEWIAFGTGNALKKIDRSGGRSMTLAKLAGNASMGSGSAGVWNSDGTIFFTTGNSGVFRLSSQAGEVAMHHKPQAGEIDFHQLCSLPGDRGWVLIVHTQDDYGNLSLLTPDGQRKALLSYPGDAIGNVAWSPSGHLLFHRTQVAAGIWAIPFSLEKLEVSGEAFLVAADGQRPSVSQEGTLVFSTGVRKNKLQLVWFDRQGNELGIIGDLETSRPFPNLSPDETKVLIAATADNSRELWLFDTVTGNERRLTFDGLNWDMAIWHPDGKHLVGYTDPDYHSFLVTLDGSEPRRDLGPAILSCLSSDGRDWVYALPQLDQGFDFDIFARPLEAPPEEGRQLVSSPAIEWYPRLSPDSKYLLYTSNESGVDEIYATTYPGLTGRWQVSRQGGNWAAWRGDGKEIYFTTHEEMFAVSVDEDNGFTLGRPRKLFDRPMTDWSSEWPDGFDVTGDGERFVMLRPVVDETAEQPVLVVVQNWYAEFTQD